jgi:hypothetical protein
MHANLTLQDWRQIEHPAEFGEVTSDASHYHREVTSDASHYHREETWQDLDPVEP